MRLELSLMSYQNQVTEGETVIAVEFNRSELLVREILISDIPNIYDKNGLYFFCSSTNHYAFADYNVPLGSNTLNSLWRYTLPLWTYLQELKAQKELGCCQYLIFLAESRQKQQKNISEKYGIHHSKREVPLEATV